MPDIPELDESVLGGVRPDADSGRGHRVASIVFLPLALLLIAIIIVFYVVFSATVVDGPSMLRTLRPGDRLLITKSYDTPRRGDIVVATITGENGLPDHVVKRVIAIPGDTVEIRNDVAIVNGKPEPYPEIQRVANAGESLPPQVIRDGDVFILGDNRPLSYDSRYVGGVPLSAVEGRATFIFAPLQRVGPIRY